MYEKIKILTYFTQILLKYQLSVINSLRIKTSKITFDVNVNNFFIILIIYENVYNIIYIYLI